MSVGAAGAGDGGTAGITGSTGLESLLSRGLFSAMTGAVEALGRRSAVGAG